MDRSELWWVSPVFPSIPWMAELYQVVSGQARFPRGFEWAYDRDKGHLRSTISRLCITYDGLNGDSPIIMDECSNVRERLHMDESTGWLTQGGRLPCSCLSSRRFSTIFSHM
ncbi:hypothetical protein KIN20_004923 [Parelaphostrongylus tenuis]|uniref:Ricin B lectin domain-containing protein n=1 Tax=Parelaphostrongylus tenuis TaxID=148309 RepID=A0AAD5M3S6_PARTN|nr:hypothetical protein KIN20_004923 [Parelaphostrongylus tenuis]